MLVGLIVIFMEHEQATFFQSVQQSKSESFRQIQGDFTQRAESVATRDLLRIHESGHENLAKVMANVLWERDLGPYLSKVGAVSVSGCRQGQKAELQKACFADLGQSLMRLPGFATLDRRVFGVMKNSTVFKVKMYDLRGITVYSSEHAQMGEDKSGNAGWKRAAEEGKTVSELTHRDKFSAFEGVVADRDLISSYLPMLEPGSGRKVGVFEIYSDVTPFLKQIKATSVEFRQVALSNSEQLDAKDVVDVRKVSQSGWLQVALVAGMMILLYVILLRVVVHAQKIMDQQDRHAEQHLRQQARADKASSMSQLVEGLVNQLKSPMSAVRVNLAELRGSLDALPQTDPSWREASDTHLKSCDVAIQQAEELIAGLRAFSKHNEGMVADTDIHRLVSNVVQVARVVSPAGIQIETQYEPVARLKCNSAQISQAVLNLLLNAIQAIPGRGRVKVVTSMEDEEVRITVKDNGQGVPTDILPRIFEPYFTTKESSGNNVRGLGLSITREIAEKHGGRVLVHSIAGRGSAFAICLPLTPPVA